MSKKGLGFIERMVAKLVIKKVVKLINQYVMEKSWKTTATGIGALLIGLGTLAVSLLNPDIPANFEPLLEAIQMLGLVIPVWLIGLFSRDKDVSSEEQAAE